MTKLKQSGWGHVTRCTVLLTPLILSICSVLWMGYKRHLARVAVGPESKYFKQVYSAVSANFADRISPEAAIYHGAIPGMLRSLDPHSTFFDQQEFSRETQAINGHRTGVGIELTYRDHQFIVVGCHSHSAAQRADVHPGDQVVAINGKPADSLKVPEVFDLLSSRAGTTVQVSLVRDGSPIHVSMKAEAMSPKSVSDVTWIRPGLAYIAILVFDDATASELKADLKTCQEHAMDSLILDLRDNPGGVVKAAVGVADQFLRAGETILSQRGRLFSTTFVATHGNDGREFPMVVLVNRNTASAAEALAGALQDHDRAWILGDDTYGKGLVQTLNSLPANTGLALVKSKYYTPSGRLLQRKKFSAALGHYERQASPNLVAWVTDSGRPVYAGSGIGPDQHYVPDFDRFESLLRARAVFAKFMNLYLTRHSNLVDEHWQPDKALVREFRDYLRQLGIRFTNVEFRRHEEWIQQRLRQVVLRTMFGLEETQRLLATTDPMVRSAANALPKAKALLDAAGRTPNVHATEARLGAAVPESAPVSGR